MKRGISGINIHSQSCGSVHAGVGVVQRESSNSRWDTESRGPDAPPGAIGQTEQRWIRARRKGIEDPACPRDRDRRGRTIREAKLPANVIII